jgi:16S rRNA (guanine(966)-N(2))-methyltransferase RsmD
VRVIAGKLGGRTLVAPPGASTRPTSDRVREALFSILGNLEGTDALDLYAGTGALGIEAVSRGAASATFVEQARLALRALRQNIEQLGIGHATRVLPMSVERALAAMPWGPRAFDVVFMDPPYAEVRKGAFDATLAGALDRALGPSVRNGGRVVLEHAKGREPPAIAGLTLESTRTYGDTALSFYLR